jgi:hypothetical protein
MQDTQEPDLGAEMLRIGGHFQQGSGAGLEQKFEQTLLVLPDQRDQAMTAACRWRRDRCK